MQLFLKRDFDTFRYHIPFGIYDAEGQDERGIYFKAPYPLQERWLLLFIPVYASAVEGGIYVETEGNVPASLKYWVYIRRADGRVDADLLPSTFGDGYGQVLFVEGPDGPHARAAAMRAEVAFSSDGKPNGPFRLLRSDGELQRSGTFENGQRQGVWTTTLHGIKVVEVMYRDGRREGSLYTWYGPLAYPDKAGRPCTEGTFVNDHLQGEWRRWDPNGEVACKVQLDGGVVTSAQCWENGRELAPTAALRTGREAVEKDTLYLKQMDEEDQKVDRQGQRRRVGDRTIRSMTVGRLRFPQAADDPSRAITHHAAMANCTRKKKQPIWTASTLVEIRRAVDCAMRANNNHSARESVTWLRPVASASSNPPTIGKLS